MDRWITQLRKGMLEYLILIILGRHESYGYEIIQELDGFEGMGVSESTVYPILARLNRERLTRVRKAPSAGGPPRRYYSLTSLGEARVLEMNEYWDLLDQAIQQIRSDVRSETLPEVLG